MTFEIKNSYLQWVGTEHYPTIEDYVSEVKELSLSKRIMNAVMGQALMQPGTVVFLAHDEGESTPCQECRGVVECPECRKLETKIGVVRGQIEKVTKEYNLHVEKEYDSSYLLSNRDFIKKSKNLERKIEKRKSKIESMEKAQDECLLCEGSGEFIDGTGGEVNFHDGTLMDYRQYTFWHRQPKKWTAELLGGLKDINLCDNCGGTGKIPEARVFGMFVPTGIEYILDPEDSEKVISEMEEKKFSVVVSVADEPKRGCGKRKPGGLYVVCKSTESSLDSTQAVKRLADKGLIEVSDVEICGNFVRFIDTIEIESKRFRGMKKWSLDPRAEEEAQMIFEAFE